VVSSLLPTAADVPPTWTSIGQVHGRDPRVGPSVGKDSCYGTPYPDTHEVAHLESPTLKDPTGHLMVWSTALSYDNPMWVTENITNLTGPKAQPCLLGADDQFASLLHWSDITLTISLPRAGSPASLRAVDHLNYTDTRTGVAQKMSEDSLTFAEGRYQVVVNIEATDSAIPASLEAQLAIRIGSRLAA
jgi:hypothetical protein